MAADSCGGLNNSALSRTYDVFLCFRGSDTRLSFIDFLYKALVEHGLSTFIDENQLRKGEYIGSELLKAIEESRVSIIVFSKNYASSRWCLQELVKIMECRKTLGHNVLPVFYDVDPSNVRSQSGVYAEAFARHKERFGDYRVLSWRAALIEAANLSGWHFQNGPRSEVIQSIIEVVKNKLDPNSLSDVDYPFRIDPHAENSRDHIWNYCLGRLLFDKEANALNWYQRHAIAIGTAKWLRFLHEKSRRPIIHGDIRPSNILITHDFEPVLGEFGLANWRTSDCGLAKWKTNDDPVQTLGYLAPEYTENGIVSVKTDVYAFGIVLLQLISGRKVIESEREDQQQSLRKWAEPIIQRLALHELIDPRIGFSYDPHQLYNMAKTAYICAQSNPMMRPSMGEVVHLLERGK
ncbi:proline-rich receptor-like protein kinase PERK12 [Cornus florida]|uniref:proline-rich receptor-like protein kinase PERK12 n=1 Tax=Cornus florida TaxID=4283 RepID=UPI0028A09E67|nr:proline-rich receptor-like protein kinase PERK12 [Cornus florida]